PEFLMLLKGVIDCPDLPLNVSRSALQNDGFVKKISDYITKKVADKLSGMCKTDRENYEKYWDDINPFIKFGCIKDAKFSEKMNDYILYKNLDGKYLTLKDYIEENKKPEDDVASEKDTKDDTNTEGTEAEGAETEAEKPKMTIYYVTDEIQQSQYINMFKEAGQDAVILKHNIDSAFVSHLEQGNDEVTFQRIDADLTDTFKEEISEDELKETTDSLTDTFRKALGKDNLDVKVEKLKNPNISSMMTLSEQNRRMQDMMKMYNMSGMDPSMFGSNATLVLNANNQLVQYIVKNKDSEHVPMICKQLYDLAMLSHTQLSPEEMTNFISRSNEIMMLLAK
ncbi:MAG TPA: molecular chaperone HtpG, partial [Candidatus Merdenecus merdavium]|nr:molecular chaperone HtpG [Candidatus Merdenecus merdavium]